LGKIAFFIISSGFAPIITMPFTKCGKPSFTMANSQGSGAWRVAEQWADAAASG
jgi:hypothetical protein